MLLDRIKVCFFCLKLFKFKKKFFIFACLIMLISSLRTYLQMTSKQKTLKTSKAYDKITDLN